MTVKYLTKNQVQTQLAAGKAVEQWLGHANEDRYRLIKWLRIDKERTGQYSVTYFEVIDEGSYSYLDIYGFSALNPDLPYGNISTFDNKEDALDCAQNNYSALFDKFVGSGMIQEVYAELLEKEGLPTE